MKRASIALAVALVATAGLALAQQEENQAQSEASVENARPKVVQVKVLTDDDESQAGAQVTPTAGGQRDFDAEVKVQDRNNHRDVSRVTCDATDAQAQARGTLEGSREGGNGNQARFTVSGTIEYHDAPGEWTLDCQAWDKTMEENGEQPRAQDKDNGTFTVLELAAVGLSNNVIDFTGDDPVQPGTTTDPTSLTVENFGNVRVDVEASGIALSGPDSAEIAIENVRAGYEESMNNATRLASSGSALADFDLEPGQGSTRDAWFTLDVPSGDDQYVPPGNYEGHVTLTAIPD